MKILFFFLSVTASSIFSIGITCDIFFFNIIDLEAYSQTLAFLLEFGILATSSFVLALGISPYPRSSSEKFAIFIFQAC